MYLPTNNIMLHCFFTKTDADASLLLSLTSNCFIFIEKKCKLITDTDNVHFFVYSYKNDNFERIYTFFFNKELPSKPFCEIKPNIAGL